MGGMLLSLAVFGLACLTGCATKCCRQCCSSTQPQTTEVTVEVQETETVRETTVVDPGD